jgi:Transcriptional regulator
MFILERKGRNTKQKIIEESMKLFSISGFDTVSIRAIAEAVGVGNSALYKHFKSKKEILNEIVSYSVEYYLSMGNKQMTQIKSEEDLQKACLTMFEFQTKDEWMVMFRRLLIIEQFKNPEMADIYRKFFIELPVESQAQYFGQLIEKGIMKAGNEKVLAMELYAPFYLYHLSSDSQQDLRELFKLHIKNFWEKNIIRQ